MQPLRVLPAAILFGREIDHELDVLRTRMTASRVSGRCPYRAVVDDARALAQSRCV